MEVVWLRNNEPLSLSEEKHHTVNKDCTYQIVIPEASEADSGIYTVQGGDFEAAVVLSVSGEYMYLNEAE